MAFQFLLAEAAIKIGIQGKNQALAAIEDVMKEFIELETTIIRFQTLTGDAEIGSGLVKQIREFSKISPLFNKELFEANKTLIAYGISITEAAHRVEQLSDISLGTGRSLASLTRLYGQMRTRTVIYTRDLNRLANAGINVFEPLKEITGKTAGELRELAASGQFSSDLIIEAFDLMTASGGRFANATKDMSQSIKGLKATISDNLDTLKIAVLKQTGLEESYKRLLFQITSISSKLVDWSEMNKRTEGELDAIAKKEKEVAEQNKLDEIEKDAKAAAGAIAELRKEFDDLSDNTQLDFAGKLRDLKTVFEEDKKVLQERAKLQETLIKQQETLEKFKDMPDRSENTNKAIENTIRELERLNEVIAAGDFLGETAYDVLVKRLNNAEFSLSDDIQALKDELNILLGMTTEAELEANRAIIAGVDPAEVDERKKLREEIEVEKMKQKGAKDLLKAEENALSPKEKFLKEVQRLKDIPGIGENTLNRNIALAHEEYKAALTSGMKDEISGGISDVPSYLQSVQEAALTTDPTIPILEEANVLLAEVQGFLGNMEKSGIKIREMPPVTAQAAP